MTTDPLTREPLSEESSNLRGHFGPSPSQTVGPYFHQGLIDGFQGVVGVIDGELMLDAPGERLTLRGRVLDGDGQPVEDALLEFWAGPDAAPGAACAGYGRVHTRTEGHIYSVRAVKPSARPGHAPRLGVWLGLRGLLTHLITFVYFSDEDNSGDPLLALVPEARRHTLIAQRQGPPDGPVYTLDIHLQGERETAFFDVY